MFQCREKLVGRQQLMRENYKVNHGLSEACRHDIRHYQCLHTDHSITTKHGKLSLIILCLEGVQKEGMHACGCRGGGGGGWIKHVTPNLFLVKNIYFHIRKINKKQLCKEGRVLILYFCAKNLDYKPQSINQP